MEGDAGASRLTPSDSADSSEEMGPEVTTADSAESDGGAETTGTEVTTADSAESDGGAETTGTEVTTADSAESDGGAEAAEDSIDSEDAADGELLDPDASHVDDHRGASRLGRGWFIGIAAALAVLAGGIGAGGAWALIQHRDSVATARHDAAAVEAAKTCVAATQAPDTTTMAESAQKIIECGAGAFRSQAILYSSLLVEAYQAANAHVEVSDLRAAVERNNPDGSIAILVPLRVKVSNSDTQNQEAGYRLRVTMVPDEGQYKISKLDQVAR
jgi:Mce-associated membrane protein